MKQGIATCATLEAFSFKKIVHKFTNYQYLYSVNNRYEIEEYIS